jgi:cytochrome P450/NADPH-cytochrome P450 reductase
LEDLSNNDTHFEVEILDKRTSIFSLLTRRNHDDDPTPSSASIKLPFGEFLAILPPLHVRQYSISSSPLFLASNSLDNGSTETVCCSITYGVIDTQALSDPEQRFEGVAGHYLRSLNKGDAIQVRVRPGGSGGASRDVGKENGSGPGVRPAFRMPLDPETTPLLMFAAGTGLAPFRGFIQQRAIRMRSNPNRKLARAVLFLGCRTPTGDRLYADEMDAWAEAGVVEVRYAFSKDKEASQDCAHVPDRMLLDADDIVALWRDNARVYVCGSRQFQQGVRDAAHEIASMVVRRRESKPDLGGNGGDEEDMKTMVSDTDMETTKMEEVIRLFRQALQERVASDVFD